MIAAHCLCWAIAAAAFSTSTPGSAGASQAADTVEVLLFTRRHPARLAIQGAAGTGGALALEARGDALLADGQPVPQPLALPAGAWRLAFSEGDARWFEGALSIRAQGSELRVVGTIALEAYVAQAVAAETLPGTTSAALEAQAIVARTYALAVKPRHSEARLCDLAHCQVLHGASTPDHLRAARQAARATRGALLCLESGELALPVFHASCGGQTARADEVFQGRDRTGSASVLDPGCRAAWRAEVPLPIFREAIERHLGAGTFSPGALRWARGTSGRIRQLELAGVRRPLSGDALQRALGARLGYGQIPSALFWLRFEADRVHIEGRGRGHGVGLCQEGAARQSRAGQSAEKILEHYFPRAHLCRAAPD